MNASTLTPINKAAKMALSSGKTVPTLRGALCLCGEKLSSYAATASAARNLNEGAQIVEWRIKVTKSQIGQFTVKMSYRQISAINELPADFCH